MPIVTIRGQLGSGAPEIGKEVARLIGGDYVDREILEGIAKMLGRPLAEIEDKEHIPTQLIQKIIGALEGALERSGSIESAYSHTWQEPLEDAKYLDALESVIQDLALERNIVLRGRGSQFILHNNQSAFHVLVIAPLQDRVKRVMATLEIGEDEALRQIEEFDNSRRAFIRRFFKGDLDDPVHYDMVINTEHLTYDTAARIIVTGAEEKTPWAHG